jgi:hypothetical protein
MHALRVVPVSLTGQWNIRHHVCKQIREPGTHEQAARQTALQTGFLYTYALLLRVSWTI